MVCHSSTMFSPLTYNQSPSDCETTPEVLLLLFLQIILVM